MTGQASALLFAALFIVAFVVGLRSTLRLASRYGEVAPILTGLDRLILQAFVVVAGVITAAAGVFGFLAVRRVLGFEQLALAAPASVLLSAVVLFLPVYLEWVVDRVASDRRR